jgi:hypothetical protein
VASVCLVPRRSTPAARKPSILGSPSATPKRGGASHHVREQFSRLRKSAQGPILSSNHARKSTLGSGSAYQFASLVNQATGSTSRVLRSLVLGGAVAALTLIPHTAALGTLPSIFGVALVLAICSFMCSPVKRGMSHAHVFMIFLALQMLGHVTLTLTEIHSHLHVGGSFIPEPTMLAFHVAGGLLAALIVIHADRISERFVELIRPFIAPVLLVAQACDFPSTVSLPSVPLAKCIRACVRTDAGRAPPIFV